MALEGDLSLFRLPDVLQVVAQQRKTGILTVQGKSDILAVSFLDGEIVAADALNQSFDDLLGEVLERRGVVDRGRFGEHAERQRGTGERLIDSLIDHRLVSRDELLESLRELTYRLLLDVLRWREGQFKFYGGEEVAFEEGIRPLTVQDVLMRALGDLADEPGQQEVVPRGFHAYLPVTSGRNVQVIPSGFEDGATLDPEVVWITPEERSLLERLDGHTPAEVLARNSGLGEQRTYYALHRLLQAGLARVAAEGESAVESGRRPPPPRSQARAEALRVERRIVEAADLPPLAPNPFAELLARGAWLLPLVLAAVLAVLAVRAPAAILFPAPGSEARREDHERLLRLERFALLDRAARTFHLLEGRYPVAVAELVNRGLLPARAARGPRGGELALRSEVDTYQIVLDGREGVPGVREGVYGDFLLDRSLFSGLSEETAVPLVLVD
jgi:hypothetical protein